jgi:outer membrane lipoprotein-sorting protein
MKLAWQRSVLVTAGTLCWCALWVVAVRGQAAPEQKPQMAEDVFKNVQVLKGIPVDEFMDTMGMFAAATAKDCTGCHAPEILSGSRDAFAKPTPMIQMARMMTVMMNNLDRQYFGGRKRVTCYTCHTGTPNPARVPNLAIQYGTPPPDNPNAMEFIALPDRAKEVDQIFSNYIQAIGGAQRLNGVTSFVATGTYAGWDTAQSEVALEIVARAPDQLTTTVRRNEGSNTWVFDGRNAWFAGVDSPISNYTTTYTGGNLAGARLEALVALGPTRLQQAYSQWQVSEGLVDDDKPVVILQGTNQGQTPVNLYFDDSGLLVRMVRWSDTAVGAVPVQYDYSDYRDVGGTRRPFRTVKTWTNNKVTFTLKDVRLNAAVDAGRFVKPAPVVTR